MPHAQSSTIDSDIIIFSNTVPPPPYPGPGDASDVNYDLTPTPQSLNRPRLPEERRNHFLRTCESGQGERQSLMSESVPDDATIVKFQTIVREGREIVVGRIKVPTVSLTARRWCFH